MVVITCAEVQSSKATLAKAVRQWEVTATDNTFLNGFLDLLTGSGIDARLMEYFTVKDLAVLGAVNSRLHSMCKLFCVERLRFFFGLEDEPVAVDLILLKVRY